MDRRRKSGDDEVDSSSEKYEGLGTARVGAAYVGIAWSSFVVRDSSAWRGELMKSPMGIGCRSLA